jgi:hypothetical protein
MNNSPSQFLGQIENPKGVQRGVAAAELDGETIDPQLLPSPSKATALSIAFRCAWDDPSGMVLPG